MHGGKKTMRKTEGFTGGASCGGGVPQKLLASQKLQTVKPKF